MSGTIKIPEEAPFYMVTYFEFTDGRMLQRGLVHSSSLEQNRDENLKVEVMWDEKERGERVSLAEGGGVSHAKSGFWHKARGSIYSDVDAECPGGFRVVAFSQSAMEQDGTKNEGYTSDLEMTLKRKKYVGAAVVKFFKTQKECSDFIDTLLFSPDKIMGPIERDSNLLK